MSTLNATIPANEARSNLYQILNEVGEEWRQFTITHRGKPRAVIISPEEFASWQETLEIASNKQLVKSIKKGLRSKKTYSQREADKIIGW
ncbi:hypothetical protein A2773_03705 [Candidatus Gottesmanbacteria bacterium RIFCSPHIGHO2_01_FULL_39_10]|uniref:Antitoxin n=1 Tax=Candidatus Gottesmanbacteria bacterium RIFCSPHIGHO2_01_FULL_39_10 TaxID=1798375 RepID=A0A1F5ZS79_9BACT|nr:MAG: hypothetical protein A2773_03705 [Candidatus Gottesmanbacteria bacterium RIFCSPHIGHO2_01_FULL_39_10]